MCVCVCLCVCVCVRGLSHLASDAITLMFTCWRTSGRHSKCCRGVSFPWRISFRWGIPSGVAETSETHQVHRRVPQPENIVSWQICETVARLASRHVTSCFVTSSHVTSCFVTSSHVTSCFVMSSHVTSCFVTSSHIMSTHVTSHQLIASHHIMSCQITSSRHVTSRHVA